MRGFYSSLLQRNAQLKSIYGGGSMSTLVLMDEDNLAASASGVSDSSAHSSDAKKAQVPQRLSRFFVDLLPRSLSDRS